MAFEMTTTMAALRDVARQQLKGAKGDISRATADVEEFISALEPETEQLISEAVAASEEDRQQWIDAITANVDAVTLRTLRNAAQVSVAWEKRLRDGALAVILTIIRVAA